MPDKHSKSGMQKTWTIRDMIQWATAYFVERDIDSPRLTIEMLLCHTLRCSRMALYTQFDKPLSDEELTVLRSYIQRRGRHEPTQYIIGSVQFFDMHLQVNSSVLIPRPETEELVALCSERIHRHFSQQKEMSILDVGTGSGCIAIALAKKHPQAQVFGIDISMNALELAKANAQAVGVGNVQFGRKDFLTESFKRQYDVVISNPPYIAQSEVSALQAELRYEPQEALTDRQDGFAFYRCFAGKLPLLLKQNEHSFAIFEMAYNQADAMHEIFASYSTRVLHKDFAGIQRFLEIKI